MDFTSQGVGAMLIVSSSSATSRSVGKWSSGVLASRITSARRDCQDYVLARSRSWCRPRSDRVSAAERFPRGAKPPAASRHPWNARGTGGRSCNSNRRLPRPASRCSMVSADIERSTRHFLRPAATLTLPRRFYGAVAATRNESRADTSNRHLR